jgi:peptide deformylase
MRLQVVDYVTNPKPLRRVARPVRLDEIGTDPYEQFVRDLLDTMRDHNGRGLAATQVDASAPDGTVWSMFAMRDVQADRWAVVLNPEVLTRENMVWENEACLSFRAVSALTRQPMRITGRCMGVDGSVVDVMADGREAAVFNHESEHLRGLTMLDRMKPGPRQKFLQAVARKPWKA